MRLERIEGGSVCASDRAIRMTRVRKVTRPDGSRWDGWEARINRPTELEVHHVARTLGEAALWARQHWRPRFLDNLIAGLERPEIGGLYRAATLGDPAAFFALLDAVQEAGRTIDSALLTKTARLDGVFAGEVPETEDERRDARREAEVMACQMVESFARHVYEHGRAIWRAALRQPRRAPHAIEIARQRLQAEGIELLAQGLYPTHGADADHTVALVFYATTDVW